MMTLQCNSPSKSGTWKVSVTVLLLLLAILLTGGISQATETFESATKKQYFDKYILKAVDHIYNNYRLLGYDIKELYTHSLPYGKYGEIVGTPGRETMCVAAQIEVILTAIEIYARETGDKSVFDFLPIASWKGYSYRDIKGHIWVNSRFRSSGTPDALKNFGMGEVVPFEQLRPGAFINFSRNNRTGHAVTFISFIDQKGHEYSTHNSSVVGFKYFSAQGRKDPVSGFDYRYAVFKKYGCPKMPYKHDCGLFYSRKQTLLNTGRMFAPTDWQARRLELIDEDPASLPDSVFDSDFFSGDTVEILESLSE